jgi:hypothetical protein
VVEEIEIFGAELQTEFSRIGVSFKREKSQEANPGPMKVSRPRFPYLPAAGAMKALGLK